MKKIFVITGLIIFIVIPLILFVKHENPLTIGEDKYLKFLWMVDGAFNDDRFNTTFTVNNRKLPPSKKKFSCTYDKNSNKCLAKNFENAFDNLFSSKITYDKVYGDSHTFSWLEKVGSNYYFTNRTNCNQERMSSKHHLEILDISKDRIIYKVTFEDHIYSKDYEGDNLYNKRFILVKENGKWKIEEAYYHDLCYMDYYIE